MSLIEQYNKTDAPVFVLKFPAFNPNEEELKRLVSTLSYVVKSFNEKNTVPVELDVLSMLDVCPRSTFCGPEE